MFLMGERSGTVTNQRFCLFAPPGDATYLDIFREFSHMASHDPEKLKRRSVHFRHSFR